MKTTLVDVGQEIDRAKDLASALVATIVESRTTTMTVIVALRAVRNFVSSDNRIPLDDLNRLEEAIDAIVGTAPRGGCPCESCCAGGRPH